MVLLNTHMRRMGGYANWSKEALISRILSLENTSGSSIPPDVPHGTKNGREELPFTTSAPNTPEANARPQPKRKKQMDFSKFATRRVAIRFAYLGWNYHGLAYQKEGHKTVEYEILRAFHQTKCIPTMDPAECNFSRCGRTDADVSAMAQVISLDLRSVVSKEEHASPEMDTKELDYLKILNSHLPADIIAYQICLRPPPDFDARFSCLNRHYHYYFDGRGLDIEAMQTAANKFLGEHDFRNFCKIDGSKQITNFNRQILESQIMRQESTGMYYLSLKGTAFLWNQVRSIMAILFMIGGGHERPDLVDNLLDVAEVPRRPAYEIAWGVPLVLYNCDFPANMEWKSSTYTSTEAAHNVWHELMVKQSMTQLMIDTASPFSGSNVSANPQQIAREELSRVNIGQGIGRKCGKYTPVMQRPVAESADVQNQKWLAKKKAKKQD